jgi:hypothetical protein
LRASAPRRAGTRLVVELSEVVDITGEFSAGVSFAGEISVDLGHGARATRFRTALREKWPAEFLDGGKLAAR